MKPAPFDYHAPTTLDEAVDTLGRLGEDAKVLAGGQSLVPILALRLARFDALIDLGAVESLRGVEHDDGTVIVGAMTSQAVVGGDATVAENVPLLARAMPLIGHFQIRNRGTLGGSIAHADPAAELPAVAVALDADFDVASSAGVRTIAASDFFDSAFATALDAADVLTAVRFPVWGGSSGFAIEEIARRGGDFALAGVACGVQVDRGKVSRSSIALFGMGSVPIRASEAEAAMMGNDAASCDSVEIGRLAVERLDPPSDVHASSAYRRAVAAVLVSRALRRALQEAVDG